jgi:hypothetical protein
VRLIRSSDHTLRQYVLGELREHPRLEIEERLITDPDVFDALGVAEEELADEYLDGTLSAADKLRFEQHYLINRDRQRRVNFVRRLKSYAMAAARRAPAEGAGDWQRIGDLVRFHPRWAIAAAAVLILLMGGNLWFVGWNYRLQGQLDQVRAQQGREEQSRQQLQGQLPGLTDQANTLQRMLDAQQGGAVQLPTFGLTPGRLRGPGSSLVRVVVPAGAAHIRLQLQLPGDDASLYRAVLSVDAGAYIWFQSKLNAESNGGRDIVTVLLPAQVLAPGDYQLKLSGTAAQGALEVIATYSFRVNVP